MQRTIEAHIRDFAKKESKLFEFLRFGFVGIIATTLHYGIYLFLLNYLRTSIAYTIGYALSFIANFYLSSHFTFKTKPNVKKGFGFGFSHLINYILHMGLLNLFIWFGLSKQVAPIPVFAIVIPVNFLLVRTVLKSEKL